MKAKSLQYHRFHCFGRKCSTNVRVGRRAAYTKSGGPRLMKRGIARSNARQMSRAAYLAPNLSRVPGPMEIARTRSKKLDGGLMIGEGESILCLADESLEEPRGFPRHGDHEEMAARHDFQP